jgi:DNA polymerase III epsilon subunit family exonuclease
MLWRNQSIIAFDTETTGLNPQDGDRVIEFAAVEMHVDEEGRVERVERHEMLINPGIPIPREVVKLTGITDEKVADAPPFEKRAKEILGLLENNIVIAHNFQFDQNFLAGEFRRLGRFWPDTLAEIDTLDLSIRYFPNERGHKLGMMSERLGVILKGAHRASNDAEACGRCFTELARRLNAPQEFEEMLEWATALGRPPESHWIRRAPGCALVFGDGEHEGQPIEYQPRYLQWMLMARVRKNDQWEFRYPENLRRWIERYLRCRGAGRARGGGKSFGANDWGVDSNAVVPPSASSPTH